MGHALALRSGLLLLALSPVAALAADPAPPAPPSITGAVKGQVTLTAARLATGTVRHMVKVAGKRGAYRATLELDGVPLASLLDEARIEKTQPDGFNRPLDTWIEVTGRNGSRAVFSWGEVFAAGDPSAVLVADRVRLYLPHHHAALDASVFDATRFLGAADRASLDASSCASCHAGPRPPRIDVPRGVIVAATGDPWPGRFVEDVVEIRVRQAGITFIAPATRTAAKQPVKLVAPDGSARDLVPADLERLRRVEIRDASIGMGRGFHGLQRCGGVPLSGVIAPLLPREADPAEYLVLVTATDGYRSIFSGAEVFRRDDRAVVLVDREDGAPLPAATAPYRVLAPGDFFVDRSVRQVSEIRLINIS